MAAEYKNYAYKGDIARLADPAFRQRIQHEMKEGERRNAEAYAKASEAYRELLTKAIEVYGVGSKEGKYLRNNPPIAPTFNADKEWKKLLKKFEDWQAAEQRRAYQRQYRQERKVRLEATIAELEAAGYKQHEDFDPAQAISFARRVFNIARLDE